MNNEDSEMFYIANRDISTCLIGDREAVLYHPDTGREKFLNPTGRFIWERLDGSLSVKELTVRICEDFASVPLDQVSQDVVSFIDDLSQQGFINDRKDGAPCSVHRTAYPDMSDAPKSLDISLTGKCNLHCEYCFYAEEMKSRPDLPIAQWQAFFDELGRLAVRDVCLSGGEVFVRPDLWELIDALIANRMRYSILTNGTLITEKIIQEFEIGKRRKRLSSIQISVDGSCPEVHDKSRGKGSFGRAIKGLRFLKEIGFPVTSRVTVNRYNVDDLDNIAALLLDDIGIASFSTNDAMPMGAGCTNQASIALLPDQQVKAMKSLARLAERYEGRIQASAGPLAKWKSYREMEHAKASGEKAATWQMGYLTACGCMFSKLAVHHDGLIAPCNILAKLEMGRINIDYLSEIWKTHPILQALKDRRKIPMNEVLGCEDCEWAPYCNGGCPGLAYEMTGDFNRANPHDCYRRFLADTGLKSVLDMG
jgi:SynChlorMet cassette radical SAM/SPASM protein ScmE